MSWESFKDKDVYVVEYKNYEEIIGNELARKFKANGILLAQITPEMRKAGFGGYHSTTPPTKNDKREFIIFIDSTMGKKNRIEIAWHEFGHFKVKTGKLRVPKKINQNSSFYKEFRKFGYPKSKMAEEMVVETFAKSKTRNNLNIKNKKVFPKQKQIPKQNNMPSWGLP